MAPTLQEVPAVVPENLDASLLSGVMDGLSPGSSEVPVPGAAAPVATPPPVAVVQPGSAEVDVADLVPPGAKPAVAAPVVPTPVLKPDAPAGLTPGDLKTPVAAPAAAPAADGLPDGLAKEEEFDTLFKGDPKGKHAIIKERAYNKQLREELRAAKALAEQAQAGVAAQADAERFKAEAEAAKAKADKLEADLGKLDLTRSPQFRAQFDDRINQLGAKMVQALVKEGVEEKAASHFISRVVAEPKQSVREQLIEDAAPGLRGTLASLALQVDEVAQARAAALEDYRATAAALEDAEARGRVSELTGKVDEVVKAAVGDVEKLGNPYFMRTDDAEWNLEVDKRVATVRGVLLTGDFTKIAPLVAEGLNAADLRARYSVLLQQKRSVEAELDAALKGAPRFNGRPPGGPPPPATPAAELNLEGGSIEEHITEGLRPPGKR